MSYREIASQVAELVEEKQKAYGDSFGKSGQVMRLLYPEGVPPEKLDDALVVVRVLDKLFRVATRKDAFGESPWRDVIGYALLAVRRDESRVVGRPSLAELIKEVEKRNGETVAQPAGQPPLTWVPYPPPDDDGYVTVHPQVSIP